MNFGTEGPQYKLPGELELGLQDYWFLEEAWGHVKKWVQTRNIHKISAYNDISVSRLKYGKFQALQSTYAEHI